MDEQQREAMTKRIIAAFAAQDTRINMYEDRYCPYCKGHEDYNADDCWHHDEDCLILQARKIANAMNAP